MSPAPDDDASAGYGARRGWRAPKGGRGRGGRRRGAEPRRPPADDDAPPPDPASVAGRLARALDLDRAQARALADADLPAPGAPDLLPRSLAALGRLLARARHELAEAREQADVAAVRRARDAERGREGVRRAQERAARAEAKAAREQGERQRLAGELERAHARLTQVAAERDRLRQLRTGDAAAGAPGEARDDAAEAGLRARVADLERQLDERALVVEELTDAREAAERERERLRASARRLRRIAVEAGASDVDLVDPEDAAPLRVDELPAVRTVLEAVELAAAHAEHLVYTERAFSTARTAPYDEPRKLLRDLVALDRVAAAWDEPGGIGRPIRDVALEQQLDWADDVSVTARAQNGREYQFAHRGRPLWAGPHVRVATGRGLQRTCRVYLALVKGTEPDLAGLPRGIYVGPVGRHLSDSTSG
ncbi:hypothetical protein [Patulibacter sp. SYSU D01012]|uniref:hypothetical protein n=1 Tax=Patulibacter sp. SYSU D01012 TaxID=2817381 RepID=UPI001B302C77|nr:hypothetical protein [Patulibacter sp. SYSU D01012]